MYYRFTYIHLNDNVLLVVMGSITSNLENEAYKRMFIGVILVKNRLYIHTLVFSLFHNIFVTCVYMQSLNIYYCVDFVVAVILLQLNRTN